MADLPETIVTQADQLRECCSHLRDCDRFGFDTEFIGEDTYYPKLCLVQVATPERLILIDPLAVSELDEFWELVADPTRTTVVHAGREEIRICKQASGRPPGGLFDLQVAAGLLGHGYPAGHATLAGQLLKAYLSKGETLTDWSRRPLTRHQIRYAYDDVRFLLPMYDRIHGELARFDRLEWADEEFTALLKRSLADAPDLEPWRKLRGLGSLDRRKLAVAREVFAWRDARAAKLNRPARFMLRDDLIIEVAKRLPKHERDLTVMRGVPKNAVQDLLAAVSRGLAVPAEALPAAVERDNDPAQVALVASFMLAVLGAYCAEQRLTPSLVATTSDIKAIVRARLTEQTPPADSVLTQGWRKHHVLPVLLEVLEGKRGVRVGDLRQPSPFVLESE